MSDDDDQDTVEEDEEVRPAGLSFARVGCEKARLDLKWHGVACPTRKLAVELLGVSGSPI